MKKTTRISRKLPALFLSLCITCSAFWGMGFTAAADAADAALSSLSYRVNGGPAAEVPDFDSAYKGPYWVSLPRSTPRDAQIALSGEPSGDSQVTGTTEAALIYGVSEYEKPAQITVALPGGTPQTYAVHFYIEPLYADIEAIAVAGIADGKAFAQNESPSFTAAGPGMDNDRPVDGDDRYRPVGWQVDDGSVLKGQWDGAPFTGSLDLSRLSTGSHTLTVQCDWERFEKRYENNDFTGEYGWVSYRADEPEKLVKTVSFTVTKAPVAAYTVTFDSRGGSAVSALTGVHPGETIAAPAAPTRDGYVFGGWYRDAAGADAWDFDADTVAADITLYAKWNAGGSTFPGTGTGSSGTPDPNGGTGPSGSTAPDAIPPTGEAGFPLAAAVLALVSGCVVVQTRRRRDRQ